MNFWRKIFTKILRRHDTGRPEKAIDGDLLNADDQYGWDHFRLWYHVTVRAGADGEDGDEGA